MTELPPDTKEKELALIQRILAGDKELYRILVESHQRYVYQLVLRQVNDQALATEITQDVFIKVYRNLHLFRGESRFGTWLDRIAVNTVRTFFTSKRGRERKAWENIEDHHSLAGASATPEKNVANRQDIAKLRKCLSKMKPRHQEVVYLCVFEERTSDEAAKALGVPVGTVHSRLSRALSHLMAIFADESKE